MRGRREVWVAREVSWQVWGGQVCIREGSSKKSSAGTAPWRRLGPLTVAMHEVGCAGLGERVGEGEEVGGPRGLELQEKCKQSSRALHI